MEPGWLGEIDPATSPPFGRMGTRALPPGGWLLDGDDVAGQLAEKQRVLAAHHDDVVAAVDGSEEPAGELLDAIRGELPPSPPAAVPPGTGGLHPIDLAGRLVAEDLCLLVPRDGRWVLGAGSVCFPSHWSLPDKVGLPVAAVHAPVPDYAADLAERVDRFLDRLRVGRGTWRRNWTVHTSPDLHAPHRPPPPDPPVTVADAGRRLWLRSERQTLTRLPRTGAVAFTIRTQQVPLGAVAAHPELRARMARAAAAWPPHQVAYRGGDVLRHTLVAWLAGTEPAPA
jgi:heme-dependent oxidative N-demethylase alpha subunit-like protein